jgi:hypothetical protein
MALYSLLKLIALGALFHEAAAFATVADPPPAKSFNTYDECAAFAADYGNIVNYCGYSPCSSTPDCGKVGPQPYKPDIQLQCLCPGKDSTSCEQKLCKLPGQPFCVTKRPTTGPDYFSLYCD